MKKPHKVGDELCTCHIARHGEATMEHRFREPLKLKGTRTHFRTVLGAPKCYKFATDIWRRPIAFIVLFKKGDLEEFKKLIIDKFPSLEIVGLPITIVDWRKK